MPTLLRLFSAVLSLALMAGCSASSGSKLIGQPAPETRITLLDGDQVALNQYIGHGSPVVVAFWATTCMYSPRAVEKLDHLAATLKPRGVQFIAISIDKEKAADDVRNMIKYRDMKNFTHAFSGNDVHDEAYISFDGGELPYILVIDGTGKVVAAGDKASVVEEYFKPA